MTPTEAIMAALDNMTSLYGPCLMDDEDWADSFLAALPPGWRLCGPDDVTVTVDGLAWALHTRKHPSSERPSCEFCRPYAAAILAALSAARTKRPHRHVWIRLVVVESGALQPDGRVVCRSCGAIKDEAKSRRGKTARQRGNAYEREIAHKLGIRRT